MPIQRFNLTFNKLMANQPIMYNLAKKYRLVTVIEKANVAEEAGWMQISFNGDRDEVQRAIADLNLLGVIVTPLEVAVLT